MAEFFAKFGVEQWLALMSAVLAISSFVLNMRLVARQEKRNATSLKLAHDSDVIGWSDEVIDVLVRRAGNAGREGRLLWRRRIPCRRSDARARLSALIDRGRALLPEPHR